MSTFFRGSVKENFHRRIREYDGAHIASVGNQAWQFAKGPLAAQQRFAHAGKSRHFRGRVGNILSANLSANVLPLQYHFQATVSGDKTNIQVRSQRHQRLFGFNIHMMM